MSTADTIKAQLRKLIADANAATGRADANLTSAVNALMTGYGNKEDSSDATAVASDIRLGKTAYVNGQKVTGTLEIYATGMALSEKEIYIEVGASAELFVYLYPGSTTDLNVTWKSSDESVATVNNGVVSYVNYGSCIITASLPDRGLSASCAVACAAQAKDIMSYFKWLGPTTYSPGTYTAWCPTGLIYDKTRDVYAHFMVVQNSHYTTPNACELWFNTIDPETLEHTDPVFVARTGEKLTGTMSSEAALGSCIKDGSYYVFADAAKGYYKSTDGGATWSHEEYETGPDKCPWGCYVLSNGRMIMGSDTQNHKVYYSDDNGKNWASIQSAYFNEPTFIDFGNGQVMAICRENMDANKNIQPPWMHISYDYGETWTDAVAMESVGYMGNNNCNAYVHDQYVELFVGCRIPTNSPQYTDTLYQINQYVMDLGKGPSDSFEFVNTVYQFKNDDNPQGLVASLTSADDFSTPCIAIKDKAHAVMMFYAPSGKNVTHHLIAVGNVPADGFEIPKPMPTTFKASQTFTGNNEEITICGHYGVNYYNQTWQNGYGYPILGTAACKGGLLLNDIEEGGYIHARIGNHRSYNAWDVPILTNVVDLSVFSGYRDTQLPSTPLPLGATSLSGRGAIGNAYYPDDTSTPADIYARFKDDAWWLFYEDSWIRSYTNSSGIAIPQDATGTGYDNAYMEGYTVGGFTTYKTFAPGRSSNRALLLFEYDKSTGG